MNVKLGLCVILALSAVASAAPTPAEKARKAAEKRLDAFEKNYDPSKDLSRKNPEKLEKDVAELDAALAELKALDAAAATELTTRRDALVNQGQAGVSSAALGKNDEVFTKHFTRLQDQVDPQKARLENLDPAAIKRMKDEVDRDIAKFEASARKPYEDRRDALFAKLKDDIAKAKLGKQRSELTAQVPELKPAAGVDAIAPMTPTWCEGVAQALAQTYSNYHVSSLQLSEDTPGPTALGNAVTFSCLDPEHDVRQKWVAFFRQGLANRTSLGAAATERLMKLGAKLAISGGVEKQLKDTCAQFEPLKTGAVEARYSRNLERKGLNCGTPAGQEDELVMNSVDVPNGLSSQLAGAVLANRLTTQGFHTNDGKLTAFAVANAVITFDAAAFERELVAWKLNEAGTITATQTFYGMAQTMKTLEVEARARNKAVLLDAPKKGAQAFAASLANSQSAINVALALEDQKRAGSLKGCAEKLYPELVTAVKGQKAALDELRLDGLLAYKLTLCGRNDPDAPVMEQIFGYYAAHSVPVRGPFTAAYLALVEAHNASGADAGKSGFDPSARRGAAPDEKGPFVPDSNPIEPPELEHTNTMNPHLLAAGVVKSIEKKGELMLITFRTEHYMVPVLECHETNKIDRIASDGTILYRSSCKKVGEKEEASTNEPIAVPGWAAKGVAAGSFLFYQGAFVNDDVKGQPHRGWVVEAYDSKAQKNRTSLFGIAP